MGIGVLNNIDRDWARYQLEREAFFPTTELATSQGVFELNQESAQKLLLDIEAGEDDPSFNWTAAGDVSTYASTADYMAKFFISAGKKDAQFADIFKTAVSVGSENLGMSPEENVFYHHYLKASMDLALDYYFNKTNNSIDRPYELLVGFYNATQFAISAVTGLRETTSADVQKFIDKNRAKVKFDKDNIYNKSVRDRIHNDLKTVASALDGRKGLSDTELLAANAVYYSLLLDENFNEHANSYFLDDFGGKSQYCLTPIEDLILTALVGAYYYLQAPLQDEQVVYVTLDDFEFKSTAGILSSVDPQKKTEIIKENIRRVIEDTYKDIKGVKIVYTKPTSGIAFHTVHIPSDIVALSEIYRQEPPSKDECYRIEKKLAEGNEYQKASYAILMHKYSVPCATSLCATDRYSELMAEPYMAIWYAMEKRSLGHVADSINLGGRKLAESAYVYGHIKKLGVDVTLNLSNESGIRVKSDGSAGWDRYLEKPIIPVEVKLAAIGDFIGSVAAHEMGHLLGLSDLSSKYQGGKPHLMMMKRESGRRLNEPRERHLLCEKHKTLLQYFFR